MSQIITFFDITTSLSQDFLGENKDAISCLCVLSQKENLVSSLTQEDSHFQNSRLWLIAFSFSFLLMWSEQITIYMQCFDEEIQYHTHQADTYFFTHMLLKKQLYHALNKKSVNK